jgi:hypothetical protein
MSLLSAIKGIGSQLKSDVTGGLDLLSATFSHPVKTIGAVGSFVTNPSQKTAQKVSDIVTLTNKEGPVKTITNTAVNTLLVTAAVTPIIAATGGTGALATIGKGVTTFAKAHPIVTAAAPVVLPGAANLLTSSPQIQQGILAIPDKSAGIGGDIAEIIKQPSWESGLKFLDDHPYFSSGAAVAALVALGFASVNAAMLYSNWKNTKAVKENTEVAKDIVTATLPNAQPQIIKIETTPQVQSPPEKLSQSNIQTASKAAVPSTKKKTTKKKVTTKKKKKTKKKVTTKKKTLKTKKTTKKRKVSKKKAKKR